MSLLGIVIAKYFENLEKRLFIKSDKIVTITEDFNALIKSWGNDEYKIKTIPNWAPIDEIPLYEKKNKWAKEHYLDAEFVIMYSGTLGLKHNPKILLEIAQNYPNYKVVVISEGIGAEWLRHKIKETQIINMLILNFQPFNVLPKVLATADILVGILEKEAGIFSVPSKILTYLCASRPIVLSVPQNNLAAKIIKDAECGFVVAPEDISGLIKSIKILSNSDNLRRKLGINARKYAEQNFNISIIANQFLSLI